MPMSLDALANAARLRQSPGRSNFANYEEIFAPSTGSAHEMLTGRANAAAGADALGATPAFTGMRRAFDANRLNTIESQLARQDDLASGRPQDIAMQEAQSDSAIEDFASEAEAMRGFTPFKHLERQRDLAERDSRLEQQYVIPAQLRAQGDVAAAQTAARGRVDAATARDGSLSTRGLLKALTDIISQTGKIPSAQEQAQLQALFSGIK